MSLKPAKCPKCGNLTEVDDENRIAVCTACKSTVYVKPALDYFAKTYRVAYVESAPVQSSSPEDFTIEDGTLIDYKGSSLEAVIPDSVTRLGKRAFKEVAVNKVVIPASVKEYTESFAACTSLKEAVISEGIGEIPREAFCCCKALEAVDLPSTLKEIGDYAFSGCGFIELALPEGVERIGERAFAACAGLERITLPASLKEIGANAFIGCKKLTEIVLPEGLELLGEQVFCDCAALESLTVGTSLEEIPAKAFSGCKALTELDIPKNVKKIGKLAFGGCKLLNRVSIAAEAVEIGEGAFAASPISEGLSLPEGASAEKEAFKAYWKSKGLCPKCGSKFQGKKCKVCEEK